MPVFPTREWCEAVISAVHADPESQEAGDGWSGDGTAVVLAEPPSLEKPFGVHVRFHNGGVESFRVLDEVDEVEKIDAAFKVCASYSVWRRLLIGQVDPVEALIKHEIDLHGDLQPLLERMQHADLVRRILERVPTTFLDGPGPETFPKRKAAMALDDLKNRALDCAGKALERVLSDERHAANVAQAVGAVQKGKESLERVQQSLMSTLGVASRRDYQEIGQRISTLKRRARQLSDKLRK